MYVATDGELGEEWLLELERLVGETSTLGYSRLGKRKREAGELDTLSLLHKLSEDGQSFLHRGEPKLLQPAKVAKKMGAGAEGALIEKLFGVLKHVGWTDQVAPPSIHLLPSQGGRDENDILVKHQNLQEVGARLQQEEEYASA